MKQSLTGNSMTDAVGRYAESIAVPAYDARAVDSRRGAYDANRGEWRNVWVATAAGAIFVVAVALGPAVVAQVERVMQAFAVVNGQTTQLPVK